MENSPERAEARERFHVALNASIEGLSFTDPAEGALIPLLSGCFDPGEMDPMLEDPEELLAFLQETYSFDVESGQGLVFQRPETYKDQQMDVRFYASGKDNVFIVRRAFADGDVAWEISTANPINY